MATTDEPIHSTRERKTRLTARENEGHTDSGGNSYLVIGKRQLTIALQFLTGSLVTFGGTAFALLADNGLGTTLGSIHLLIGVVGLFAGIITARRKVLPRNLLLAANLLTILYSIPSVSVAGILSLLPSSAFHDSLIGTAAAVIMSSIVIYLLPHASGRFYASAGPVTATTVLST